MLVVILVVMLHSEIGGDVGGCVGGGGTRPKLQRILLLAQLIISA